MAPLVARFAPLRMTYSEVLSEIDKPLLDCDIAFEGSSWGYRNTLNGYEATDYDDGLSGCRPDVEKAIRNNHDAFTMSLCSGNVLFGVRITNKSQWVELTFGWDSEEVMDQNGPGWLVSLLGRIMAKFSLEASFVDRDEPPNPAPVIMVPDLVDRLTGSLFPVQKRPLLCGLRASLLPVETRKAIIASGVSWRRMLGGFDFFSWLPVG